MAETISNSYVSSGTTLTKGYQSVSEDHATDVFIVSGLAVSSDDNFDAIDVVKTAVGDHHHSQTNLPVRSITSQKFGKDKARVRVNYGRTPASIPTVPAHLLARYQIGSMGSANQQPNPISWAFKSATTGSAITAMGNVPLTRYYWDINVAEIGNPVPTYPTIETIIIPTVLDVNPKDDVQAMMELVNDDAVKLADIVSDNGSDNSGYEYPAYTLKFRNADITPVPVGCGVMYLVRYIFDHRPQGGWVSTLTLFNFDDDYSDINIPPERLLDSGTNLDGSRWYKVLTSSNVADFTEAFPTHTPLACPT